MATMPTARQEAWNKAAEESAAAGDALSAGLFSLIGLPNEYEREHSCREHALGFSRDGRRGFRCGICRRVIRWVD